LIFLQQGVERRSTHPGRGGVQSSIPWLHILKARFQNSS